MTSRRRTPLTTHILFPLLLLLPLTVPAAGEILEEDFNGPILDLGLWSVFDQPGNGANINQTNGRLEFSTINDPFAGGGQAGIYGNSWAISTAGDFQILLDYNLTIGNPGATTTGLQISLFSGNPNPLLADDWIDIFIYRWGTLFWVDWSLTAGGDVVQHGFTQTDANVGTLQIYYSAAGDWLTIQSIGSAGGGDDPINASLVNVTAWTDANCFQLYLGGFQNGVSSTPVNGDDAWYDDLLVSGLIVDLDACTPATNDCPSDTNDDGMTDITDVIAVVLDWGTDGSANNGDIDGSGFVDVGDLVALIDGWGACPE